ncbi:MAG: hypothetical protein ACHQ7N_02030 [Candidatus Methylomirabilales bacterium]
MTWAEHHDRGERLAAEAEVAARHGDPSHATALYLQAAEAELLALNDLDPEKVRTLGITAVSAVALFYKAHEYARARRIAHNWLSTDKLPGFAIDQLQVLLQTIWSEQVRQGASVRFSRGEVLVSVKGGQVLRGGAPLDLIVQKVEAVQSLFYRTTEFLKGLPHRKRGPAPIEIQQLCRPWLFQTAPGSYQFAVAIEEPAQKDLFEPPAPGSQEIATTFLRILRATADDPDGALLQVVSDPGYRGTFLKLTRSLAPTGETFEELEIRAADEPTPITLVPGARRSINEAIRRQFPKPTPPPEDQPVTLRGVLRALDLDRDWLELVMDTQHVRVEQIGDTVDDVVGPMVNRMVIVDALRTPAGRYLFQDMQSVE